MIGLLNTGGITFKRREYGEPLYKTVGNDVGGYIEIVRPKHLPRPYVMIVNEEGLLLRLPWNMAGSLLYGEGIAGNIVIMREGFTEDGEPDILGLEEDDIDRLAEIGIVEDLDKDEPAEIWIEEDL